MCAKYRFILPEMNLYLLDKNTQLRYGYFMKDFDQYKRLGEPAKQEKSELWEVAIGLQQVDGLTPSDYLIETAKKHIEGDITIGEVKSRLNSYYKNKPKTDESERTEEADKVAAHIEEVLGEKAFTFSPAEYIGIHKRLFNGIYKFAGKIRDYNITKDEWVLNGETVYYASADMIKATLDYDFAQEKAFKYKGLDKRTAVEHIAKFISGIWQIHAFGEGNTRTTAVFTIKYLRTFGFAVTNDLFKQHSWYFRNALVRANYTNYAWNVFATEEYLNRFFGNLILGENYELKNRELQITVGGEPVNEPAKAKIDPVKTKTDAVLALIAANPAITLQQMAAALGISVATIKRRIIALKESGRLTRVGSDKTGIWQVTKGDLEV
jgi:fido (protein-threonine AMPylation protein)